LELKIENERLRQELNGMYNEMEEQADYGNESSDYSKSTAFNRASSTRTCFFGDRPIWRFQSFLSVSRVPLSLTC
jgi:hypothetical protein